MGIEVNPKFLKKVTYLSLFMPGSHNLVLHWIANPGPSGHLGSNPSPGVFSLSFYILTNY